MQFSTILAASLLAVASAQVVENPEPAAAITDNPVGKTYVASFDGSKGVEGKLTFTAGTGGEGVDVTVKLSGFAGEVGPFGYHIHDQPVPESGNCTLTLAHLDPYGRGQTPACDSTQPETCEVGDLAGKHGKIPTPTTSGPIEYETSYNELYASTKEDIGAFLGNRSIVIHRNDTTRLACVNLVLEEEAGTVDFYPGASSTATPGSPSNSTNGTHAGPSSPAQTSEAFTGAAVTLGFSSVLSAVGLMAGLMAAL